MKKTIGVNLLAVVALGLAVVGCGGSDEATAVSKADFLTAGNQICAETIKTQTSAYERIGAEVSGKQLSPDEARGKQEEFVEEIGASVETMISDFEELGVPPGKEESVNQMLDEYGEGAEESEGNPQRFFSGKAFEDADASAKRIGLHRCEGM